MTTDRLRVLVADDNADAADSLGLLVRLWGHDVCVAYHGSAALVTALDYRPEAALIDIAMPGVSGTSLARELRRHDGFQDTLLVAVTGYTGAAHEQQAREAGFDRYLVKPVEPDLLERLLTVRGELKQLQAALRAAAAGTAATDGPLAREAAALHERIGRSLDALGMPWPSGWPKPPPAA